MRNRQMFPSITIETHLFSRRGVIYMVDFNNYVRLEMVDFEEDEWRHDN